MLLASIYHSLGDRPSEFKEAIKAQQIAKASSNSSWQASVCGFLATSFRHVGLMNESRKNLSLAEEANERQHNSPNYTLTKINIEHEKVFHAIEENNYEKALAHLEKAKENIHYGDNENSKSLLIKATNDQLFGVCYLELGKLDLADSLLRSSLARIDGEENNLRPYIYRGLAEVAIGKGSADSALRYLRLTEPYLESSDREELKLLFYESSAHYHKLLGSTEEAVKYQELYVKLKDEKVRSSKAIADAIVSKLGEENRKYEDNLLLGGGILFALILTLSLILLYLIRQRSKDRQRYIDLVHQMKDKNMMVATLVAFGEEESDQQLDTKDPMISRETEERLLKQLTELEAEAFFLDKNISLTKLANQFGTNQRYISYIVRKHSGMDFNSYIHQQRIHYIINRIRSDKKLLDYKLSYLAEIAGFSSHSKFSSVFKTVTGLTPSVFIHFTKEEMSEV